jgi:hypothetical protein
MRPGKQGPRHLSADRSNRLKANVPAVSHCF